MVVYDSSLGLRLRAQYRGYPQEKASGSADEVQRGVAGYELRCVPRRMTT